MEHQTDPKPPPQRVLAAPTINKSIPWGYFDGASQGVPPLGGAGGLIYLNDDIKSEIMFAPGRASNSKAEIAALWAVLRLALDKKIEKTCSYIEPPKWR